MVPYEARAAAPSIYFTGKEKIQNGRSTANIRLKKTLTFKVFPHFDKTFMPNWSTPTVDAGVGSIILLSG